MPSIFLIKCCLSLLTLVCFPHETHPSIVDKEVEDIAYSIGVTKNQCRSFGICLNHKTELFPSKFCDCTSVYRIIFLNFFLQCLNYLPKSIVNQYSTLTNPEKYWRSSQVNVIITKKLKNIFHILPA